jgi:hypothetical protein
MYTFKTNELIEVVLYSDRKIKSYIKYLKLIRKLRKISPDYNTLEVIYEFMDQLNFAYFYCLDDDNHLFIGGSRKDKKKTNEKSLMYKDGSVTMLIILEENETITIDISRYMGYKHTSISFRSGQTEGLINNKLEEQLFINCTDLIMDALIKTIKRYRKFRRIKW